MSRKTARESTYKLIFEYLFNKEKDSLSYRILINNPQLSEDDASYVTSVFFGVAEHFDELSEIIAANAKGFSFERIYKTDLAALFLAVYEMKYTDIPKTVAISEAVAIVKLYSTEKSSSFVNGILASVFKQISENNA